MPDGMRVVVSRNQPDTGTRVLPGYHLHRVQERGTNSLVFLNTLQHEQLTLRFPHLIESKSNYRPILQSDETIGVRSVVQYTPCHNDRARPVLFNEAIDLRHPTEQSRAVGWSHRVRFHFSPFGHLPYLWWFPIRATETLPENACRPPITLGDAPGLQLVKVQPTNGLQDAPPKMPQLRRSCRGAHARPRSHT